MTVRVVLDTNVICSALGWKGPSGRVLDAVIDGCLVLVTSAALLAELRRVLAYPKLAVAIGDPVVLADLIEASSVIVAPQRMIAAVADEPDNRVLEAAVQGDVDYVVSGDKHLLALGSFEAIPILAPAAFLTALPNIQ